MASTRSRDASAFIERLQRQEGSLTPRVVLKAALAVHLDPGVTRLVMDALFPPEKAR